MYMNYSTSKEVAGNSFVTSEGLRNKAGASVCGAKTEREDVGEVLRLKCTLEGESTTIFNSDHFSEYLPKFQNQRRKMRRYKFKNNKSRPERKENWLR